MNKEVLSQPPRVMIIWAIFISGVVMAVPVSYSFYEAKKNLSLKAKLNLLNAESLKYNQSKNLYPENKSDVTLTDFLRSFDTLAEVHGVKFTQYSIPVAFNKDNVHYEVFQIGIEGNYGSIVKTLHDVMSTSNSFHLVGLKFEVTNAKKLSVLVLFQKVTVL